MHRAEPHYLNTGCQFLIPFYPAISTLTLLQTTFSLNSWGGFSSALDNNLCSLLFSYGLTQKHKCPRKGFTVPEQCWIPCRSGCITLLSKFALYSVTWPLSRCTSSYTEHFGVTVFVTSGSIFLTSDFKEGSQVSWTKRKPLQCLYPVKLLI